jgi:hypothetical protein
MDYWRFHKNISFYELSGLPNVSSAGYIHGGFLKLLYHIPARHGLNPAKADAANNETQY